MDFKGGTLTPAKGGILSSTTSHRLPPRLPWSEERRSRAPGRMKSICRPHGRAVPTAPGGQVGLVRLRVTPRASAGHAGVPPSPPRHPRERFHPHFGCCGQSPSLAAGFRVGRAAPDVQGVQVTAEAAAGWEKPSQGQRRLTKFM